MEKYGLIEGEEEDDEEEEDEATPTVSGFETFRISLYLSCKVQLYNPCTKKVHERKSFLIFLHTPYSVSSLCGP